MPTLTDTQLVLLSKASQRPDGAIVLPEALKGAAATRVAQSLLDRGLITLVEAGPAMPVWRRDDDGTASALVISHAGLGLLGLHDQAPDDGDIDQVGASSDPRQALASAKARKGTKKTLILELLQRQTGASLTEITAATGWLPHTARAELSRLRRGGHAITRDVRAGQDGREDRVYRLAGRVSHAEDV